jgi:hypothetical protein
MIIPDPIDGLRDEEHDLLVQSCERCAWSVAMLGMLQVMLPS